MKPVNRVIQGVPEKAQPTCLNLLEKTPDMYMAFSSIFRKPWVLPLI